MKIAITGATGFLGRYIANHLASAGHHLRAWYRQGSDRSGFDASALEWQLGELGNLAATRQLVSGVDAVVHGAVEWRGPRNRGAGSHGDADPFFGINLTGSLQLFQTAFEAGVPRFVFISSCACTA